MQDDSGISAGSGDGFADFSISVFWRGFYYEYTGTDNDHSDNNRAGCFNDDHANGRRYKRTARTDHFSHNRRYKPDTGDLGFNSIRGFIHNCRLVCHYVFRGDIPRPDRLAEKHFHNKLERLRVELPSR